MGGGVLNCWSRTRQDFQSSGAVPCSFNWAEIFTNSFDVEFLTAGLLCELWECKDDDSKPVLDLSMVSLLVLDESHHAGEGKHDFGKLARCLRRDKTFLVAKS